MNIKAWDADQVSAFLDLIASHRLFAAFQLSAYTGMRHGEISLRWGDLDVEHSRLSVQQALVSIADLVFTPDGVWVHSDIFSQIFDRKVEKLDVPTISLHDLRHTHAKIMLKTGVPVKVVSERLGHVSGAFTMSVYQHVLPGMQAEAAAVFARLLEPSATAGDLSEAQVGDSRWSE